MCASPCRQLRLGGSEADDAKATTATPQQGAAAGVGTQRSPCAKGGSDAQGRCVSLWTCMDVHALLIGNMGSICMHLYVTLGEKVCKCS